MSVDGWQCLKPDHTSSWSDSTELNPSYNDSPIIAFMKMQENSTTPLLDSSTVHLYQCIMRAYADILHRWNLLDARAEVLFLNNTAIRITTNICKNLFKNFR